jgi:sRNA-binding protein
MRYLVTHRYGSSTYGPWAEGDHIELDPTEAEWVNHDSPGTLEKVDAEKQARDKREKHEADEKVREEERAAKKAAEDPAPSTPARRAPTKRTGTNK